MPLLQRSVSCALCPVPCALCPVPCALCPVPCATRVPLPQLFEKLMQVMWGDVG